MKGIRVRVCTNSSMPPTFVYSDPSITGPVSELNGVVEDVDPFKLTLRVQPEQRVIAIPWSNIGAVWQIDR